MPGQVIGSVLPRVFLVDFDESHRVESRLGERRVVAAAAVAIGAEDKLPRRVRAVYLNDPALLRHEMELSNWQLDPVVATEFFESARAAGANRIAFAKPSLPALPALPKTKPSKSSPPKKK